MSTISVTQKFGSQAVPGEYAGATTVLRFGSVAEELNVLRHGCAIFDLGWRGKLVVSGDDRVRWLNGMVTNNTRDLPQDIGNFSYVLNAQGRIQGDILVFQRGDFYILETEVGQIAPVREFLERFIIMDQVEFGDIGDKLTSLGIGGPRATEVLRKAQLMSAELKPGQVEDRIWEGRGFTLVRDPVELRDWYELWLTPENVEPFWKQLLAAGGTPIGADALELQRILLGIPRVGFDIGGRDMVMETGQSYALHFSKGCYIGQEIVERVHARGLVHRSFSGLILQGPPVPKGSKVISGTTEVGETTSSAEIPVDGKNHSVALAYLKRALVTEGAALQVEGRPATLSPLPFRF